MLLPNLLALVNRVADINGDVSIWTLIEEHRPDVLQIAAVSLGREVKDVERLKLVEFVNLVEALLNVNRDFMYRVPVVVNDPQDHEATRPDAVPERLTVDQGTAFIERLVNDLRAARVCTKREALDNTLADNLALSDALGRRDAREQLATLDALQGAIGAAFSADVGKSLQQHTARLQHTAGFGTAPTYTGDTTTHL